MEEIIEGKEQLENACTVNVAAASEEKGNDEGVSSSLYGKFKDADSLLNGYKELEKEFTKKCQQLSELRKSNDIDNTNKVPIYKTENWRSEIKDYLAQNNRANDFAVDIAKVIMQDEKLACMPNCLDLAYNKVLADRYKSEQDMARDDDFLEKYIYNDENIKSKIVSEYLAKIKNNTAPPIILKAKGDSVGVISPTKPKNLSEARMVVERLFK